MSDHGTRARYLRGCRCEPCGDAHRRYTKAYKHRTKAHPLTGVPAIPTRVDVQPIRAHIDALLASGWTKAQIQREAGLTSSHVSHISLGHYPTTNRRIAARILALEPLRPVDVDPVVVERLLASPDVIWRTIGATRPERIAAAELLPSRSDAERRFGLRAGRDFAVRGVA